MCTAATYKTRHHYFGRNLDLERGYDETVTITPRNYPFRFRRMGQMNTHYALIGMASIVSGYPLYYEATNEKGLSIAGLNFPRIATYYPENQEKDNITPFELIPWLLGQCENLEQARRLLSRINLVKIDFSDALPLSPLHWIIADRNGAITVEPMDDGLKIYDNPIGVLANNPPFDSQMYHLASFMNLTRHPAENRFCPDIALEAYSLGLGSYGLPGDLSSPSRFVKAAFTKLNSISGDSESDSISQFFHILDSVAQQRGLVRVREDLFEYTRYTCCCNTDTGVYYYTTYNNHQITAVDMHNEDLTGTIPISYPLVTEQQILVQNKKAERNYGAL
jgi:choloylglycine hydrolase